MKSKDVTTQDNRIPKIKGSLSTNKVHLTVTKVILPSTLTVDR